MQMCHTDVDGFRDSFGRTKIPDIKTTIVVDRSFPNVPFDKEVLSVHCA